MSDQNNTPEGTPVTPAQTPVDDHHSLPNPTITISSQATDYTNVTARCLLEGTLGQTAPNEHAKQLSIVGTTSPPRLFIAANDYIGYDKSTAILPPPLSKWLELQEQTSVGVTQNDIKTANIGQQFLHCVVCLGSNQKFERCVIKKVRTALWEVLDEFGLDLIQHSYEIDEDGTGPVHDCGVKFRMPTIQTMDLLQLQLQRPTTFHLKFGNMEEQ